MQFTGLKDKNGKEIYAGDIVAITAFDWPYVPYEKRKEVVEWNHGDLTVMRLDSSGSERKRKVPVRIGVYGLAVIEIIGNISENLNLLRQ